MFPFNEPRVLIVEPDLETRTRLIRLLSGQFDIMAYDCATSARLAIIEGTPFDIMIISMDKVGQLVAQAACHHAPKTAIVFLTDDTVDLRTQEVFIRRYGAVSSFKKHLEDEEHFVNQIAQIFIGDHANVGQSTLVAVAA